MVLAAATVTCCWGGSSLTFDPDDRQLSRFLERRSAEFSGAELARLKKRTYCERQKTRWWFRNRFRNLLQCTSSTIFYENVSLGSSSGSGSGSRRNKKATFFVFLFQFVCASEKGDLESPMAASCVPAEDVETWVAAKLTTTTTTTTEETRLPCSNNFFLSLSGAQLS